MPLAPAESPLPPAPAEQHPAQVYLARLASAGSRRTQQRALNLIAELLGLTGDPAQRGLSDLRYLQVPWGQLRYQHTAAIRARLQEQHSAATANKALAALKGVLREAWRLGQMEAAAYQAATDLASIRAETLPRGRALAPGEIAALLDACLLDESPAGWRDAALIAVLRATGLRRAELVALDLAHYEPATAQLIVRRGKGRKDRTVYLEVGAQAALDDWLQLRGPGPGPLFYAVNKAGAIQAAREDGTPARLSTQAVFGVLRKRGEQAGLAPFSPHDLRRTFVSDLLDAGADIVTVQRLAGHSKTETTARYDRRGEAAKRSAVNLLHVPYRRRRREG